MREFLSGYILGEIWLPLLLLFLLGYLISWLIHRWRRRTLAAGEWNGLATRADESERNLAKVSAARDEAINERSALSGRINGLTTDLDARNTELAAVTRNTDALNTDLEARNAELATLRAELNDSNTRVAGLEEDVANSQSTIAGYVKLEGDAKKLRADLDASKARVAELEGASKGSADELASLRSDLQLAEGRASEAEGRSMELEGELRAAQADLTGAQADLAGSSKKIGALEASVAAAAVTATALKSSESKTGELEAALGASREELDASQTRIADLEARLAGMQGDVDSANARVGELEGELGGAQSQIAGFANLEPELGQTRSELEAANARAGQLEGELASAQGRIAELEAANARIAELEAELDAARSKASELDGANARIAQLEGELDAEKADTGALDAANARIAELEAALDGEDEEDLANAEQNAAHTAAWASGAWMVGQTALGTAGVEPDHVDDLKKIKGIGPKLEGVLNDKGVQTYEQLAALTNDEQAIVDGALDAFPGRIYRDEWVPQAQSIMANGHAPLTNAKKADLESANARIDALEAELADAASAHDRAGALEAELDAARADTSQLDGANARIGELEGELSGAQGRIGELEGDNARIAELESELGGAQGRIAELEGDNARIAELEGELGGARNQISGFANLEKDAGAAKSGLEAANARIAELEEAAKAESGNAAEIGQLRVDLAERDRRIEALENAARAAAAAPADPGNSDELEATIVRRDKTIAELRSALKGYKDMPEGMQRTASWHSGAWKKGTTKLGTDGSDHADDLKVISGIGPQMEQLLNTFDIKSWEQLAALDAKGVESVDGALTDFPGRITRDQWVEQAKAIMAAGHDPSAATPPKRKKAKKKTPSWQKGTTKLGTPGAKHKDDLKVINGIGPKMESILNSFGIQTWEQVGVLKKAEVQTVTEAIDTFPGRIERDEWVQQAKDLVKRFKDVNNRPTRETFLNDSGDDDPFN